MRASTSPTLEADLAAVLAEPPPSSDPVALRARLDAATNEHNSKQLYHERGYVSDADLDRASRARLDAIDQLELAQAQRADWQRAHDERVRKARSRLNRAQIKAGQAQSDTYVRSPAAGVVARIERHPHGPERTDVRIVLVESAAPLPFAVPVHQRSEPLAGLNPLVAA